MSNRAIADLFRRRSAYAKQNADRRRSAFCRLVGREGFEPSTN
jgi:hypothetical protein